MKCQQCAKTAVVHLTEIVQQAGSGEVGDKKQAVEFHLCLDHAVTAGLLTPLSGATSQKVTIQPLSKKAGQMDAPAAPVPAGQGIALATPADMEVCPVCGMNWTEFKAGGVMGCGHDYEQFAGKLLPLVKRAQEGATEHMGKVPARKKTPAGDRQVATLRLRRELRKALDAEKYEEAAQLRDQLRTLEQN